MQTEYVRAQWDTFIYQLDPNRNYSDRDYMSAGRDINGSLSYMLLNFGLKQALPKGSTIVSADLLLTLINVFSATVAPLYGLHRIQEVWSPTVVTWSNCPLYDPVAITTFNSPPPGLLTLDITTLAQQWLSGEYEELGVLIKGDSSFNAGTFARAATTEREDSDQWPRIRVVYNMPAVVIGPIQPEFINTHVNLLVPAGGSTSNVQDVSLMSLVSAIVTNNGPDVVGVHLEISADGSNYIVSGSTKTIAAGGTTNLVADIFALYLKVVVVDNSTGGSVVDIYYQGQIG